MKIIDFLFLFYDNLVLYLAKSIFSHFFKRKTLYNFQYSHRQFKTESTYIRVPYIYKFRNYSKFFHKGEEFDLFDTLVHITNIFEDLELKFTNLLKIVL